MTTPSISELLIAVDGTPRSAAAAHVAAGFAERLAVPVSLVRCCRPYVSFLEARADCEDLGASLHAPVKRVEVLHSTDVVDDILATASDIPGSTICLASHGRTEVGQALLSSVSRELVDRCTGAVMLIGPHATAPDAYAAVAVAFDDSPLARRAVDAAAVWAHQLGATPWLTRVVAPAAPPVPPDVADSADLQRAAKQLAALGTEAEWEILHGDDPAAALTSWGASHGVALYLAGAHSRRGLRELWFGSVANALVHTADRPVLVAGPATL